MNTTAFGGTTAITMTPLDTQPTTAPTPAPKRKAKAKPAIMPASMRASRSDVDVLRTSTSAIGCCPTPTPLRKDNTNLTEDIEALTTRLGKSLGVVPGPTGHDPDMFVKALGRAHATLTEVRADLGKWQDQLSEREVALQARELAVQGREAKAKALVDLCGWMGSGDPSTATQTAMPKSKVAKWIRRWLGL